MTWGQVVLALAVVIVTAALFVDKVVDTLVAHPNGLGLVLALFVAGCGFGAVRSVWRDRL